jgi:hypothetical protein
LGFLKFQVLAHPRRLLQKDGGRQGDRVKGRRDRGRVRWSEEGEERKGGSIYKIRT